MSRERLALSASMTSSAFAVAKAKVVLVSVTAWLLTCNTTGEFCELASVIANVFDSPAEVGAVLVIVDPAVGCSVLAVTVTASTVRTANDTDLKVFFSSLNHVSTPCFGPGVRGRRAPLAVPSLEELLEGGSGAV